VVIKALIKGWTGELRTAAVQSLALNKKEYRTFSNVLIETGNGSTQIDHIVVSRYGVFVVETKNKSGWIFGSRDDAMWTLLLAYGNKKFKFQNPLRQNYKHTKTLCEFLGIDHSKMHSVVVFWGDCKFKTEMPENVVHGNHTGYMKTKKQILLTEEEIDTICEKLRAVKNNTSLLAGWNHARDLKKRYQSTSICPKCGGALVQRIPRTSKGTAKPFLGCENFPRCHYTKVP